MSLPEGELMIISWGMFPVVLAMVKDFGRLGVSMSSMTSSGRERVGEPPLTVALRCLGSG